MKNISNTMTYSPLSQSQLGIYYACQSIAPGSKHSGNYQLAFLYHLPKEVDTVRLKKALDSVVMAHPYLLSHVEMIDGEVRMVTPLPTPIVVEKQIQSMDEVRDTFAIAMDTGAERLIRMELYYDQAGERYLYMDIHHLLADGTTLNLMMDAIRDAYDEKTLVAEPIDGAAVAEREQELRDPSGKAWQEAREWYIQTFADAAETESLPIVSATDTGRTGMAEKLYTLCADRKAVLATADQYGVKENIVVTSAFGLLLSNYTAEDKASFSTIYHGRDEESRYTYAMMVHTMPNMVSCEPKKEVGEWLYDMQEQVKRQRQYHYYSLSDAHEESGVRNDVLFGFHGSVVGAVPGTMTVGGLTIVPEDLRVAPAGMQLTVELFIAEQNQYSLRIAYESNAYSETMIDGMAASYGAILTSLGKGVSRVGDICPIEHQQEQWLNRLNPETWQFDRGTTMVDLIRQSERLYSDRPCIVCGDREYTYREMGALSDAIACHIQEICPSGGEATVSILIHRSEWMLIASVAALKAGCAYQPLDPNYPEERLNFMVKDADSRLLICHQDLRGKVGEYTGEVLTIEEIEGMPRENKHPEAHGLHADSLFTLLYTSGSTGVPKGVRLLHSNLVAFCTWYTHEMSLDSSCRCAAYASYGFDANMLDMYPTLVAGAALYVIDEETRLDLIAVKNFYEDHAITHGFMTTQVAVQMASEFPEVKGLRYLVTGGEKMVSLTPPSYKLVNAYGPTECTVFVSYYEVQRNERNIPIGHATANTHLYVVNKAGQRVPMGAAGELWAAGAQVSGGYLNQPDKTAQAFIKNPFEQGDYACVYRTGDIVRYREDGEIEFVGRKDGQVKIRGFRIELKEVEAIIRSYPGISNVTVQAFDLEAGGKALCAYIVAQEKIDIAALNAFIAADKPPYMVPAVTMQIDEIPLNVNQKVDKRRLPKPSIDENQSGAGGAPEAIQTPLNKLEEELMLMVAAMVGNSGFGITTPLAYAGLSSISGIRLAMQVFKRYGVTLDSKTLGKQCLQDIENAILTTWMESSTHSQDESEKTDNSKEHVSIQSAPLSNAQLGVYYECLKDAEATTYNVPTRVTFPEGVQADEVADAVRHAIDAHPLLSCHFDNSGVEVVQVLNDDTTARVELVSGSVEQLMSQYVAPFNLHRGPLYRAMVVTDKDRVSLLWDVHHLVMDGASLDIFLHQVVDAIEGKMPQKESYTFLEYVRDEQAADTTQAEQFFESQLATVDESCALPEDKVGQAEDGKMGRAQTETRFDAVQAYCREAGITPAVLYLAATEYLTARYCHTKDVCLVTISNGRSNMRISDTCGMFVNTLPLVAHIGDQTVSEYLKEVATSFETTLRNENYPFAKLATKYALHADLMYEYQVGVLSELKVKDEPVQVENFGLETAKFKTAIKIEEQDGKVYIRAYYNDNLYSDDMMTRLTASLEQVVNEIISDDSKPVKTISIMTPAQALEVKRLRQTAEEDIPVKLYHQGIEHYARLTPDKIALIASNETLTYDAMNRKMNRIAHALMERGVGKGDAVVILLPRTSYPLLAMYAILKTGAAFIPCDPAYPADRIQLIVEDSEAKYVLTSQELAPNYGDKGLLVEELLTNTNEQNPEVKIAPEDLAYMIYTSGSTGRPKGVMLRHIGICSYLTAHPANRHIYAIVKSVKTYLSVSTISFDLSFKEYGCAFFNGLTCVFADDSQANNPVELAELMAQTGADCINGTPSRILQYMELPAFCDCLKHCKVIMSGGEKYSDKLLERLHSLTDARIFNTYGPTEITVSSNVAELTETNSITVGAPLLNYKEYVVDEDGNELPVGVMGELYIGGPGVAVGYNHLDELNKTKFVEYKGQRVFRSGDYARWQADGQVFILGRADNQVKLRGLRIELGEVESAIAKIENVKNVCVQIRTIQGREHLCAYFVASETIDIQVMKAEISKTLTPYMVPTAYLQMFEFPLTPNGKIDARHLPDAILAASNSEYEQPANAVEQFFAETFAAILGLDKVGANDSFFELGGTSLVVTKVIIEAQKAGYPIAYSDVFNHPTPRLLAQKISGGETEGNIEEDPDKDIRDYDYTEIDELLTKNTLSSYLQGEHRPLGNVLLTGATGFLGIHIFHELVERYDGKIYCLLRSKRGISAEERLRQMLFYYFETNYADLFGKRIFVFEGDVTNTIDEKMVGNELMQPGAIQTVMNCAAIVKHFSKGTEIEDVNVGGVVNCVDYCLKTGARMIQVSTMSVGGASVNGFPDYKYLNEQMLYVGQRIRNQYVHSKIMGERYLLDAVLHKGLDGKVMRVGTLSARSTDGEYQINFGTNSFMGRLRVYNMLGAFPYANYEASVEFSPINEVATAICLLSETPAACVLFHPFNNHSQQLGDVVREMAVVGKDIELMEQERFAEVLDAAKQDERKAKILSALLAYQNVDVREHIEFLQKQNHYTTQVLLRLGFSWSQTPKAYVDQFLKAIDALDYFNV